MEGLHPIIHMSIHLDIDEELWWDTYTNPDIHILPEDDDELWWDTYTDPDIHILPEDDDEQFAQIGTNPEPDNYDELLDAYMDQYRGL